jgi:hypothetical protein
MLVACYAAAGRRVFGNRVTLERMACPDLYTAIVQHLKSPPPQPSFVNVAYLTLTAQSPAAPNTEDALVQTVSGSFTQSASGDLVSAALKGVSNFGAVTADEVENLARLWTVTLKADGTVNVQEGSAPPFALNEMFVCTDGNCGLAPNFLVGTFKVPGGLPLPGHPVPPQQTGVLVLSIVLGSAPQSIQ